ncbi:DNA (cytosine-5-)-methyltransferase [Paenibacillus sp. FSL M7-0656]|uniref:DNA (cytosine-5-)-methyltransferase n=1 Tax=Paenibacillus sp. FSL M7-0656 TaxID=2921534 RepID=UPI0030F92A0A
MRLLNIFADNLKRYRNKLGLSQEDFAHRAGLHRTYISALERGKRSIALDNIEKISSALGVEAYVMFIDQTCREEEFSGGGYKMPIVAVDLFCGIGGLAHGLIQSGIRVAAGFDIDGTCKYTYETNNNAVFIEADISQLSSVEISNLYPDQAIRALVGCAPCQPFSRYTQRYRKEGHQGDKWRLLYAFSDKVRDILPEIVSMENVPELATESVFNDFRMSLIEMGYHVWWDVVFCPEYGVPQRRKRLVLLASRLGDISLIGPQYTPGNYLTVRDCIGELPSINAGQASEEDPLHSSSSLSEENIARIKQSVPGGTWRDWDESLQLNCHKKVTGSTYSSVYGRMSWDEPAPTITTQFYGYGNGRFGHPEQNRALSIREGAMLQSFPRDYAFLPPNGRVSKKELGIHIGNAVPVNLGRAIGESIQSHVEGIRQNG